MAVPSPTQDGYIRGRLFIGICLALVVTAVSFAVIGDILGPLKSTFLLSNYEVGLIGGAALWGMAISQVLLGPLADVSMRRLMQLAFVFHVAGLITMISATGFEGDPAAFWILFIGAIVIALGNGITEVAGNPLVTALYPGDKTSMLNKFHVWFPGGIVLGGLASYLMSNVGLASWELRLGLGFIPAILYGIILLPQPFPHTEGRQAGVSISEMFRATFTSPIFLLFLFCMMITASLELGPNRWVPAVLQAGGVPGILVLVWISGLMAVLRYFAGPFVERYSPTGLLLFSSIASGVGLYMLSYSQSYVMIAIAATIFAVGISFFWPTMLGSVNERVPRSGALGMALMGGVGMVVVGAFTIPLMGDIADQYAAEQMPEEQTVQVLERTVKTFPNQLDEVPENRVPDVQNAIDLAEQALSSYKSEGELPSVQTANALRSISSTLVESPVVSEAGSILGPAENYGGRVSFRYVAPFAGLIAIIFAVLFWQDKKRGGYQARKITEEHEPTAEA